VCSEYLFALGKDTAERVWTYQKGAIINPTIAIGGRRIYFVECRHPKVTSPLSVANGTGGRIGLAELWSEQYLVALDANSGRKLWEKGIDTADGIVVFYLSYGGERLFIASSAAGKYHLYAYDAGSGTALWDANHPWTSDNHSGHMQHPVVMENVVYLEPCGYNVKDGQRVTDQVGRHEGCATYIGTTGALIYRGKDRQIAMWDVKTGKTTCWNSLRPSCWISTIAAGGMVLSPEGGGGCSCAHWLQTSLGLLNKDTAGPHDKRAKNESE
jgi:outer membrane protein assembly factor BamB